MIRLPHPMIPQQLLDTGTSRVARQGEEGEAATAGAQTVVASEAQAVHQPPQVFRGVQICSFRKSVTKARGRQLQNC